MRHASASARHCRATSDAHQTSAVSYPVCEVPSRGSLGPVRGHISKACTRSPRVECTGCEEVGSYTSDMPLTRCPRAVLREEPLDRYPRRARLHRSHIRRRPGLLASPRTPLPRSPFHAVSLVIVCARSDTEGEEILDQAHPGSQELAR